MRDRPDDFDEELLRPALNDWGIKAATLDYAPVGFGDFHWIATGGGRRWFVTVADVRRRTYDELRLAMETAAALREEAGLGFVVAPLRAADGSTLRRLDAHRYAMSVFPYEEATGGDFGDELPPAERGHVIDLLAELHATPPPLSTPDRPPALNGRAALERALADTTLPWLGGPYSEPAQDLIVQYAGPLRSRLAEFDRLAGRPGEPVLTHGEPHPGNLLRAGERRLLIDWDTVGMAVPERDLWLVARDDDDLARYTKATGRAVDHELLALYRLRWALDDVAEFVEWFRSPHGRTADAEQSWDALTGTLEQLTR
ncbi:spectinomycin phosphotransferase [Nonomuraea thailandensis]|uniref:Spectinomycin phosphotransferase n=1 Tax=Nonomuraea thailandensis TaxID=1188745 RepID=A0A9X2GG12_9ACTN|nr:aminoglycoside phosphotransferase family protein [Nonomuraea thailandensis]MCP2353973.1 spectinomycin phosphotransferase [Nonomuraea thailandensis]